MRVLVTEAHTSGLKLQDLQQITANYGLRIWTMALRASRDLLHDKSPVILNSSMVCQRPANTPVAVQRCCH
jgi:hypothetical protein